MIIIQERWAEVRAIEAKLPDPVWMVFQGAPVNGVACPARVVEVTRETAAKAIVFDGQRRATQQEVEAHLAECDEAKRKAVSEALKRSGITLTIIPRSARKAGDKCK